uniref:Retrotransposon gag domain-containing protein n=1 Tax=Aegilops tauschii subsp. strangulata TaxID=200361 RepID=A0A453R5V0_AEGTS
LIEDANLEEWPDGHRHRQYTPQDNKRTVLTVKPAKLNISEFEGNDSESWIQNLEQYFAAARTPIEHRTELAVSYLKGPDVQWWRGTGYALSNVPWHKFCSYLSEGFATESVCDVVSSFHAAQQTSTVVVYVDKFEHLMNIMRRENPGIPDDYYVTSFVSELTPYIKSHVECFKPKDMQTVVWYARRMEKAQIPVQPVQTRAYVPQPRRQMIFEQPKIPTVQPLQNRNTIIQQAKHNQVCYKCREPWVPGHRQVCKMRQKAQIQALQAQEAEWPKTIYGTDFEDPDLENMEPPAADAVLQVSMHAAMGIGAAKNTFILTVKVGSTIATTLVDSGSTSTFVSPERDAKLPITPVATPKVKVVVASGGVLWSEFMSQNCPYEIQGQKFSDSFRVLKLKGYDMILGVDWLRKYSPI